MFINGLGKDYSATDTVILNDNVTDNAGTIRLGQNADGSGQYIGKFQDVRYYSTTLSNREVQEVYLGTLPIVRIQTDCRCPPNMPRVKASNTLYCLANGVPDNVVESTLRISNFSHPLEFANDDDVNTMWISNFQNQVAVEIDLGDQFEVFTVVLSFYSPLPKAVTIERQFLGSLGFEPWQYYAENCTAYFQMQDNGPLTSPSAVNCIKFGSNNGSIPYTNGYITFTVLSSDRTGGGNQNFYANPVLQRFVQASRVRVHFQDHFNVTNIRQEYFSLREFIITGRCACNGHAESCNTDTLPYKCQCAEESHTQGDKCNHCQALYNNKPFHQGDVTEAYNCQACQCYNHTNTCIYNATLDPNPASWTQGGGGMCVDCQHHTEGQTCDACEDGFFRPLGTSLSDPNVCFPCACNASGTMNAQTLCEQVGGQCPCKANVEGRACERCKAGMYSLQAGSEEGCVHCGCYTVGTVNASIQCNSISGDCFCKQNVRGKQCNSCEYGFFQLEQDNPQGCRPCNCNPVGSVSVACDPATGQCTCKANMEGSACQQCKQGFHNFTSGCLLCQCNETGTEPGTTCDRLSGQCVCKSQTAGRQCNECKPGSSGFGSSVADGCSKCNCLAAGVLEGRGDCTSGCVCKANVEGADCNRCKPNYFNLTMANGLGCEPCECDPSGVASGHICDENTGQCYCLTNRQGRRCDDCLPGFYKNTVPQGGCLQCACHPTGHQPGTTCNSQTGQCSCITANGVAGDRCDQCADGFYGFLNGRCTACECLPAGSINNNCSRITGQCQCKLFVTGQHCEMCIEGASNLNPNNQFGCSKVPSQQPQPTHTPLSPTSMNITWTPPDYPNGIIQIYRLFRNNSLIYEGKELSYIDTNLHPYMLYAYQVEAVNSAGSVRSPVAIFRTKPGVPSADIILQVNEIQVASASFSWNSPSEMNGPLLKYQLVSHKNQSDEFVEWEGNDTQARLSSLKPYQMYNLTVRACTEGGCSESSGRTFITKTAPPTNVQPPIITPITSTQLLVQWGPPLNPNGVITLYELWIRGVLGLGGQHIPVEQRIFYSNGQYDPLNPEQSVLDPPASSYNVTNLQPYTQYEFQVLAQNEAGRAASPWTVSRTKETFPAFMPPPSVVGVSSQQLNVSWTPPSVSEARGNITRYRLHQSVPTNLSADPHAAPNTWQLVSDMDGGTYYRIVVGLTPYAKYDFMLEACNSIGCVNSTASSGRTLPAAPEGMEKPTVDGYNSTVMEVKWRPPTSPNGPSPQYTVQKTNIALSYPASVVRGTRFPGGGFYAFPPETLPQNVDFTGIRFEFRLQQPSGLLFFAASENQQEYVAVLFKNGRPRFMFDTQGCVGISSISTFNDEGLRYSDGKWHDFTALRYDGIYGYVVVDQKWKGDPE